MRELAQRGLTRSFNTIFAETKYCRRDMRGELGETRSQGHGDGLKIVQKLMLLTNKTQKLNTCWSYC